MTMQRPACEGCGCILVPGKRGSLCGDCAAAEKARKKGKLPLPLPPLGPVDPAQNALQRQPEGQRTGRGRTSS